MGWQKNDGRRAGVLQQSYERNPQRFVTGLPQPALLPAAAWINKPKEISRTETAAVMNSSITGSEQKNGFHNCLITNDPLSGRDLARGENQPSEDLVV